MTAFGNIAYGLRLRNIREPELSKRVCAGLQIVRVETPEQP